MGIVSIVLIVALFALPFILNRLIPSKGAIGENVRANVKKRQETIASGKCPRCGGDLVLRKGKFGPFYGCSNYPKCTFMQNR